MFKFFSQNTFAALLATIAFALLTSKAHSRTYIVNGLASAVPFIGYGMNNLGKKIPGSKVFSYVTSIEGNRIIKPNILADIEARYKRNPNEPINLIGISYGANMVSDIANRLAQKGIPVNYLGIIEGTSLKSIKSNVKRAQNFICTSAECSKKKVSVASGNKTTKLNQYTYDDGHIDLGNNRGVHSKIISGIR